MEMLLLGLLNILLYAIVAAVVVFVVIYLLRAVGVRLPPMVLNLLWAIVAVVVLIMLVRLLIGVPVIAGAAAYTMFLSSIVLR